MPSAWARLRSAAARSARLAAPVSLALTLRGGCAPLTLGIAIRAASGDRPVMPVQKVRAKGARS